MATEIEAYPSAHVPNVHIGLQGGAASPMDFIKQNLAKQDAIANATKSSVSQAIVEQVPMQPAQLEPPPVAQVTVTPAPPVDADKEPPPAIPQEPATDLKSLSDGVDDVPNTPTTENWKKVRSNLREARSTIQEREAELETLRNEVSAFNNGTKYPEIIEQHQQRIAELEPYEQIVNLKMSRPYQEGYVKPLTEKRTKAVQVAAEYNVPSHVMDDAINKSKTDPVGFSRFLSQNFEDVDALEIKQTVREMHQIEDAMQEAERQPAMALESLQAQYAEHRKAEKFYKGSVIEGRAKKAWEKALFKTKEEGKAHELILQPHDQVHNEKYVIPVQKKAAEQFGRLMTTLMQSGLDDVSEEFAEGLASMVQRAIAFDIAAESRAAAEREAEELKKTTQRSAYYRPSIGGGSQPASASAPPGVSEFTPQNAAKMALSNVKGLTRR